MKEECYLCKRVLENSINRANGSESYECSLCGLVKLDPNLAYFVARLDASQKRKLSYYFRNQKELKNNPTALTTNNLDTFTTAIKVPESIPDKLNELLNFIGKRTTFGGERITFELEVASITVFSKNNDELIYLLRALEKQGFVSIPNLNDQNADLIITTTGWVKLESLKNSLQPTKKVFVAMSFSVPMNKIYDEAISPAITAAKYEPFRVDRKEHNNDIVDEIIVGIRQSKFLVADFTNHKSGVYFEAGYAMGMGIPVIWMCKEDEIDKAHFDTRQYNHITWKDNTDLRTKLENRIKATII